MPNLGVTLLEVIVTIVLLAIMGRFAMAKISTPSSLTIQAQAHVLADTMRRAQSLAVVQQKRQSVRVSTAGINGVVTVACVVSPPCATDTTFAAKQNTVVGVNASTLYFNSLGQPVNSSTGTTVLGTSFNITLADAAGGTSPTFTVTVAAVTGRVSVSP